jgi:hypothetical protein
VSSNACGARRLVLSIVCGARRTGVLLSSRGVESPDHALLKHSRLARIAPNLRALLEYILLPMLIAALPWAIGARLAKLCARIPGLYGAVVRASVEQATQFGYVGDPRAFARDNRWLRLIDHADLFLSRWRGESYARRWVRREGEWPAGTGPLIAITFHWGNGLFGIRACHATGRRIACLSTRFVPQAVGHLSVVWRYGLLRLAECEAVSGAPLLYAGEAARGMMRTLQQGDSLLALLDVPPGDVGGGLPVRLLDRDALLPSGLLKLAQRARVPVVFFALDTDPVTLVRRLRVSEPFVVEEREAALQHAANALDALIRERPAAWMFWPQSPAFFRPGTPVPAPEDNATGAV